MFNPTGQCCSSIPPDLVFICQDLVSTAEVGGRKSPVRINSLLCLSHGKLVLIRAEPFSSSPPRMG